MPRGELAPSADLPIYPSIHPAIQVLEEAFSMRFVHREPTGEHYVAQRVMSAMIEIPDPTARDILLQSLGVSADPTVPTLSHLSRLFGMPGYMVLVKRNEALGALAAQNPEFEDYLRAAEPGLEPGKIILTQGAFPENSEGHRLFPSVFEGKKRPQIFSEELVFILPEKGVREMDLRGIFTLADLLRMTPLDYLSISKSTRDAALKKFERLIESYTISPQARFLHDFVSESIGNEPIAPDMEEKYSALVELLLESLIERHRNIIDFRYGISSGVIRSNTETADEFGISRERVRQLLLKGGSIHRTIQHFIDHGKPRILEIIEGI